MSTVYGKRNSLPLSTYYSVSWHIILDGFKMQLSKDYLASTEKNLSSISEYMCLCFDCCM